MSYAASNPIPLKAALAALSLCSDEVRLPLTRRMAATRERLALVLGLRPIRWQVQNRRTCRPRPCCCCKTPA